MNEELLAHLEELGLSQKEARVYLANLMIGPASVQKIADHSGIKRVTTYVILESLVNLGLASQSTKGKKTYFTAEDPVSLQRLLDKKQQQVAEQQKAFKDLVPQLKQLKSLPAETPSVKFYDSVEGMKSMVKTILPSNYQKGAVVYGISNMDQVWAWFPQFRQTTGNPERVRSGTKSKYIYTTVEGPVLKATDKAMNRESRYLPHNKHPLNGEISVIGDSVAIYALAGSKPLGITIQSREIAKTVKAIFDLLWEASEKYKQ